MQSHQSLPIYPKLYTTLMGTNIFLPLVSCIGYLFFPDGTVQHFGGSASPSTKLWCMLVASGDILVSYLCFEGLRYGRRYPLARKLVVRSLFVYSLFHMGIFWYSHYYIEKQTNAIISFYPISLIIVSTSLYLWGR